MQEGIESIGEFVVSRGEAGELLKTVEESLDEVARLVAMPVDLAGRISVTAGRDDRLRAGCLDDLKQSIAVVALVGDDRLGRHGPTIKAAPATCPPLRIKRMGLPNASTQA